MTAPRSRPARIVCEQIAPTLDAGVYAPKVTVDRPVWLAATVIRDGHEQLRASAEVEGPDGSLMEISLTAVGDRFAAPFVPTALGRHRFRVVCWTDRWASWVDEVSRKIAGGQSDLAGEAAEGDLILTRVRGLSPQGASARRAVRAALAQGDARAGLDATFQALIEEAGGVRADLTRSDWHPLDVDRLRATLGAWYELFPRSFGGLAGVTEILPEIARLGFDVAYLPPVHPIGRTNRKGPNNALRAGPDDPGSPWAIGAAEGGHDALHPELGTLADFGNLIDQAQRVGVEIALDLALQCSPDHPWLVEHPDWFERRPDGTIKYAENPPKRYQDIHNLDFDSTDWRGLWTAIRDVVAVWVGRGVRIFRVDNPHTKPARFWQWLIADIRATHPDVVFLAEAFTRPDVMRLLAKVGFSQSYTYFTWKNTRAELVEFIDLLESWRDCYRPNLFANTPDILHAYLQEGGPPAFQARLVLAAILGASYGIYSGFENIEATPVRPGSEEYLDSEKYQAWNRTLDGPLLPLVATVNRIRREHTEQILAPNRVLDARSEHILCVAKGAGVGALIACVNLDPHNPREGACVVPADLTPAERFQVRDLLTDQVWTWGVGENYLRLDPSALQAHILRIEGP